DLASAGNSGEPSATTITSQRVAPGPSVVPAMWMAARQRLNWVMSRWNGTITERPMAGPLEGFSCGDAMDKYARTPVLNQKCVVRRGPGWRSPSADRNERVAALLPTSRRKDARRDEVRVPDRVAGELLVHLVARLPGLLRQQLCVRARAQVADREVHTGADE